jgi:hypothetical protein
MKDKCVCKENIIKLKDFSPVTVDAFDSEIMSENIEKKLKSNSQLNFMKF